MDCYLWTFSKPLNSTKRPALADATILQVISYKTLDLEDVRLELNLPPNSSPFQWNFCYLPKLGRHYRISWEYESPLWVAYGTEDHLATWKAEIGGLSAYVLRAAAAWDGSIIDNLYPADGDPAITVVTQQTPWSGVGYDSGFFVVGTIGKTGATSYTRLTKAQFDTLASTVFSDAFFTSEVKPEADYLTRAIFDPMQYLSSVVWFPLNPGGGTNQNVVLGYYDSGVTGTTIAPTMLRTVNFSIPKHPQAAGRGKYLNLAPFSSYELDLRPFGRIALDPAALQDVDTVSVEITLDSITGVGIARVYAGSTPIAIQQAQVGVSVQLSQVLRDYAGGFLSTASNIAGAVGAGVAGDVVGAIQGGLGAVGSALDTIYPKVTTSGVNGGFAGLMGQWYLIATHYNMVPDDLQHRGRPLCQVRTLSTLPGYQLCSDVDVDIPGTRSEVQAIKGYLESGYYYE